MMFSHSITAIQFIELKIFQFITIYKHFERYLKLAFSRHIMILYYIIFSVSQSFKYSSIFILRKTFKLTFPIFGWKFREAKNFST